MLNKTIQTVILADGRFPYGEIPLKILNAAKYIVCCDGAVDGLVEYGLEPYAIVGDMDSASEEVKEKYKSIIHASSHQYTNDLTKAIYFCLQQGFHDVVILGATGLREDHAFGNVSLLAQYSEILDVQMVTNHGTFSAIKHTTIFNSFPGQQVSVFTLDAGTRMCSENLKYPLKDVCFDSWWKGTLNESTSSSFTLTLETGKRIIVFQTHLPKN